jgi:phosphopantothenoylcysteine decarboxylase/phosphopantothenate--cysteine ligase
VHPDALEYATGRVPLLWPQVARYDAVLLAPLGAAQARKLALRLPDTALAAAALVHLGRTPVLAALAPGADPAPLEALGMRVAPDAFDAQGDLRPEELAARLAGLLSTSPLRGRRVLVAAGGTHEPVDAMRVTATLGDAALARALALELRRRGAEPVLALGPWGQPQARGERAFESAQDLALLAPLLGAFDLALVEEALPARAPRAQAGKLPSGRAGLSLELLPAADPRPALQRAARIVLAYRAEGPGDAVLRAARVAELAEGALA